MSVDIRSLILNHAPKREDVPTPFWSTKDENGTEQVDGHIALQDVPSDELAALQNAHKDEAAKLTAALICKALINKDTNLPVFQDTDRDAVAHLGTSVLAPIMMQVVSFFGLGTGAVEAAKKNLAAQTVVNTDSGSFSVREASIVL